MEETHMSNIKDLSRILADKRKLSVADAEKFMSLMIDVINDGLNNNKLLKLISLYSELAICGVMDGKRKESLRTEINDLINE